LDKPMKLFCAVAHAASLGRENALALTLSLRLGARRHESMPAPGCEVMLAGALWPLLAEPLPRDGRSGTFTWRQVEPVPGLSRKDKWLCMRKGRGEAQPSYQCGLAGPTRSPVIK